MHLYIYYATMHILLNCFIFLQLLTFAQDVEHELLTQVVQAERINETKFSEFLFHIKLLFLFYN